MAHHPCPEDAAGTLRSDEWPRRGTTLGGVLAVVSPKGRPALAGRNVAGKSRTGRRQAGAKDEGPLFEPTGGELQVVFAAEMPHLMEQRDANLLQQLRLGSDGTG